MSEGLNYLENYFLYDVSLDEIAKQNYQVRINDARNVTNRFEQTKAIQNLLDIRPRDLPEALKHLKCSSDFLDKYLPKLPKK